MKMTFLEHAGYAVVNFAEASVSLITLGYYTPAWTLEYLCWNGKRKAKRGNRK